MTILKDLSYEREGAGGKYVGQNNRWDDTKKTLKKIPRFPLSIYSPVDATLLGEGRSRRRS